MKKNILLFAFSCILALTSVNVHATTLKDEMKAKVAAMSDEQKTARVDAIKARVMEIKAMDKSSLSSSERKALRQELRSMNYEAKALGSGGIYLSLAAIVIIILVLILIL